MLKFPSFNIQVANITFGGLLSQEFSLRKNNLVDFDNSKKFKKIK